MRVPVLFRRRWNHDAAVGDIADHVLELDRGVMDVELRPQPLLHLAQDGLAR